MVLFTMPNGLVPVKPNSHDQLNSTVKAENQATSPTSLGFPAQQWHNHSSPRQAQPAGMSRMTSPHGRFRMGQVPEGRDGSVGQSSPKVEHQELYGREREREEYAEEQRKRRKVQDSVHTVSSQMQSQLLSPRGPAGVSGPVSTRDSSLPVPNYGESNNHSGNRAMTRMGPSGLPLTRSSPAVNGALDEPSPLGLTLRKTPSLLDLISMKLTQGTQGGSGESSPKADSTAQESAKDRPAKCLLSSVVVQDKLKASNFPATSLKIGTWERTSRYEGDLVGKCYYAKRKLVWEVLENGLKSKIEIQWSDISAMKASCPENLPGNLEIEVSRPPLFFRETNPQPRKHTLWQTSSDFTGGQATICKRHFLQFPEGVLNRHYEKLVQCDPRLKSLVDGALSMKPMSDFDQQPSWIFDAKHHQPLGGHRNSSLGGNSGELPVFHSSCHLLSLSGSGLVNHAGMLSDPKSGGRQMKMQPNDLSSPSSVMDARGNDDSGASDTEDFRLHDDCNEYDIDLTYPNPTNIGAHHDLPDVKPSCNNLFMIGDQAASQENRRLAEIRQCLLDEISGPNEHHVNMMNGARLGPHSLAGELRRSFPPASLEAQTDSGHLYPLGTMVKNEHGGPEDHNWPGSSSAMNDRVFRRDPSLTSLMACFNNSNRHGSASDLLLNLPRVASLPQLFEAPQQVSSSRYDLPYSTRPSYLGTDKLR